MIKLYTLIASEKAAAVLTGNKRLSEVLQKAGRFQGDFCPSTYPTVPWRPGLAAIELAYQDKSCVEPYRLELLDVQGIWYDLPDDLLDKARLRVFSEVETIRIAYRQLHDFVLPDGGRLWEEIERQPAHQRESAYGPYFIKAFEEYAKRKRERALRYARSSANAGNVKEPND